MSALLGPRGTCCVCFTAVVEAQAWRLINHPDGRGMALAHEMCVIGGGDDEHDDDEHEHER